MPTPVRGEKLSSFIGRYMKSPEARRSFPKREQRAAVAYSEARKAKK